MPRSQTFRAAAVSNLPCPSAHADWMLKSLHHSGLRSKEVLVTSLQWETYLVELVGWLSMLKGVG